MGRWPNRDPIGEIGGANLFAFVSPMNTYDPLGRIALIDDAAVLLVVAELAAAYACIQILTSDPVQEQCRIVYDSVASGCACACDAFLSATKDAVEVANKHLDTAYEHMGNMLGQTPKGEDPNDRERNWKQWKTTVRKSIENAKKKAAKCTTKAKEELLEKIRELEEKFRKIDENPGPRGDNNQ
jgi:hypothetical protein